MNRRDFLATTSKAACACALGAGSLFLSNCSNPLAQPIQRIQPEQN